MRIRVLTLSSLFLVVTLLSAPWLQSDDQGVPHFNAAPAKGDKLDAILTTDQLWGENAQSPYQTHAYELAAKIPAVIRQQPCYCYCDRGMGHNSLHSCFSGTHGAQCGTCHTNFVGNVRAGGFRKHAEDKACVACHEAPAHHASQLFTPTCASCHTEHVGSVQLARTIDASCTQCHKNLQTTTGQAHFETAVLRFGSKHPEFAPVQKPDPGTIAFNHALHMRANLPGPIAGGQRPVQLECADCHRTAADADRLTTRLC